MVAHFFVWGKEDTRLFCGIRSQSVCIGLREAPHPARYARHLLPLEKALD